MFQAFRLLLPALIPSWKFFKAIEPSPRVEWRLLSEQQEPVTDWREFRPRSRKLLAMEILFRLFWNPRWNENLYSVSLAERLTLNPTAHSREELFGLVYRDFLTAEPDDAMGYCLQFRLVFVRRDGSEMQREITYQSDPRSLEDLAR